MREKTKVVSLRIRQATLEMIQLDMERNRQDYPGMLQNLSQWIHGAISYKLAEKQRGGAKLTPRRYLCWGCGMKKAKEEIVFTQVTLENGRQHYCKDCSSHKIPY